MNLRKISLFALTLVVSLFLSTKILHAAEGSFELKNQIGGQDRCLAYLVGLENNNYKVLFSCRDLNYPGGETLSYYIAWANPSEGGNPIKFGDLGLGSAEFQTNKRINSIFVTREFDKGTRSPSSNVVMRGNIEKPTFLNQSQTPESTTGGQGQTPSPSPIATPTANPSVVNSITGVFKTVSVFAIIGLIALIGLVFFLSRPRV